MSSSLDQFERAILAEISARPVKESKLIPAVRDKLLSLALIEKTVAGRDYVWSATALGEQESAS